jgi:hypothetical protein
MAEEAGLVGPGTSPTPDGIRVGMTRVCSLYQGQPEGEGETTNGGPNDGAKTRRNLGIAYVP